MNRSILALLFLAIASPARAHHGVAAASLAGPEGPGAALETTSALPLPELGLNESAEQQGSEGLEAFRASLALGWFTRF